MTLKYDIFQIGRYWCLNDRLDLSNHTRLSGEKIKNQKKGVITEVQTVV